MPNHGSRPPQSDVSAALRALADQAETLEPAELCGALETLKVRAWTAALAARDPEAGHLTGKATAPHASRPPAEQAPLSQDEAARAYRIPLRTLRRLTRTGRVPSYRLGRNRMIRPTDLDRYLARCREQGVKVGTLLGEYP